MGTDPASRENKAYARITRTMNRVIAGDVNWRQAKEALQRDVEITAAPAYAEAYSRSVPLTADMVHILRSPGGKRALEEAEVIGANQAASEGQPFDRGQLDALIAISNGQVPPAGMTMSVQGADLVKRSLDEVALREKNNAFSQEGLGRTTATGRTIEGMRKRWVTNVDDALGGNDPAVNPYLRARQVYQGLAKSNEAMNIGRRINRYTPDELSEEMATMSNADKQFMRFGLVDQMRNMVSKSGARARKLLGDEEFNTKMKMVLGTDYRKVRNYLEAERAGEETHRVVLTGSPTQPRLAAERRMERDEAEAVEPVVATVTQGPMAGLLSLASKGWTRSMGPSEAVGREMADMLTATGRSDIADVLKRLNKRIPASTPPSVRRDILSRMLITLGVTGGGSFGSEYEAIPAQ